MAFLFFLPEKHSGLWGVPLREAVEVPSHGRLEHVALHAIEVRDFARVCEEAVVPPRAQEGEDDRLCEGRGLQVRRSSLRMPSTPTHKKKKKNAQFTRVVYMVCTYVFVYSVEERRGPRHEADADAGGDDLAETVEAQHAPDNAVA